MMITIITTHPKVPNPFSTFKDTFNTMWYYLFKIKLSYKTSYVLALQMIVLPDII